MSSIIPVSREVHADKHWRRFESYAFARRMMAVPLVASEIPNASTSMPLAFMRQDERYLPVALMGLEQDSNLFVSPDGRWLARYLPLALRAYPFSLALTKEGEQILCVDESSGLVGEGAGGEPFFTPQGSPSEGLTEIMVMLRQTEAHRVASAAACALLAGQSLFRPWPISVKGDAGERQLEGLYQIDESLLNELPDDAFLSLRQAGALSMAYFQLLSMQHLSLLGALAQAHGRAQASSPETGAGFSLCQDDELQFDWDR
ncbi:SapC family protein [Imhoffiella purpurea]|uniref:SapC family protein n=1 Tax=Imhoffiella purpurea TaxID=1249627 RepID=W9V970_9GAMM|nr:SapC family protein [Imhoffiella purpurea]EXJ15989.1 SapC family protein [Imhoffiella purpurea]